jgi:hypothetical protein
VKIGRVGISLLALLFTSPIFPAKVFAVERKAKAVYCVQSADSEWDLQRYRPLINLRGHTVFAQMSFTGTQLEMVRLRRFHPDYEVAFEYKFNGQGQLIALTGDVEMWGQWLAEADLFPDADGKVASPHVSFYGPKKGRDPIPRPEDSQHFTAELDKVPGYRTIQSVPCASRLEEAEKIDATQE